jgi:hypothetical protein
MGVEGLFKQAHTFEAPQARVLARLALVQQGPYQLHSCIT